MSRHVERWLFGSRTVDGGAVTEYVGAGHHVSGDILAGTASAIGGALSAIPHTRLEISSEVTFEGNAFGFEIYPSWQRPSRPAPEGGQDFLIGGNIWLPVEQARELVTAIGAALERRGLRYQFELAIEQKFDAIEIAKHVEYEAMIAARVRTQS
jgi:hypothetical protein